ncbi:hypothetical protein Geu3261_0514_003 [Komagataeibacter europaeus NBRC 3261]|uniref:Uncharacterized protein n=1 Tax=Komagataeibacter europaeus NBRC 3261 TaxID=1234669 RepID=A0A0D6Q3Y4_KOMEU|nr:hypothetical protein [Komagataeibacter europaeus]GAN98154.1 hypothetical protein Geu3261_0514_003 [Komagataeibacter europaeus NBRC 3261]
MILGVELKTFLGARVDLTNATLKAQLRDVQDALVAMLTVSPINNRPGVVQIAFDGDTSPWAVGQYRTDLLISWKNGLIQQSETYAIIVIDGVTQNVPA